MDKDLREDSINPQDPSISDSEMKIILSEFQRLSGKYKLIPS